VAGSPAGGGVTLRLNDREALSGKEIAPASAWGDLLSSCQGESALSGATIDIAGTFQEVAEVSTRLATGQFIGLCCNNFDESG
jgi:hypothetical protein